MISAIVLAAGESRRMGAQKMLLPFGSATVIAHVVDQLLNSAIDQVLVVVGHAGDSVAEALSGRAVAVVHNADYKFGMLSSVRCGLRALPGQCSAIMVALGDQPAITTGLIDELLQTFARNDKGILTPLFQGRRGHPLLFSERYRAEILTRYDDDVGLRGLLHAHPGDVFEWAAPTAAVLSDMDYPDDYRRELAALESETAERAGTHEPRFGSQD